MDAARWRQKKRTTECALGRRGPELSPEIKKLKRGRFGWRATSKLASLPKFLKNILTDFHQKPGKTFFFLKLNKFINDMLKTKDIDSYS